MTSSIHARGRINQNHNYTIIVRNLDRLAAWEVVTDPSKAWSQWKHSSMGRMGGEKGAKSFTDEGIMGSGGGRLNSVPDRLNVCGREQEVARKLHLVSQNSICSYYGKILPYKAVKLVWAETGMRFRSLTQCTVWRIWVNGELVYMATEWTGANGGPK